MRPIQKPVSTCFAKRTILLSLCLFISFNQLFALDMKDKGKIIYLIPGQGADGRLFKNIQIDGYETAIVEYLLPEKGETMAEYARRISAQIDSTRPYSFVGVSLGGMIAVEMTKYMNPEECIIIASAKSKEDIPKRYQFFRKYFPLYRILSGRFFKLSTRLAQPLFEPLTKENQALFRDMLKRKDPKFMKRIVRCIVEWENETYREDIIHIHGAHDHTLPVKSANPTIILTEGTHMMTLSMGEEIAELLNEYIK